MEDTKIIDVEYTSVELKEKNTNELANETNTIYAQMEAIGTMGMMLAAQAGERLKEIKSRIPHGEWEDWMKKNLNFSPSKAKNMIKLAEKTVDFNSIFSNRQTFVDIGISKVWALLNAPEEVAETVIKEEPVEDMSVRELKEKLKEEKEKVKQAKEDAERERLEKEKFKDEWEKSKELQKEIEELRKEREENDDKSSLDAQNALQNKLDDKERELKELKDYMKESLKESLEKEKAKLEKKKEKEIDEKLKAEREKFEKESEEKVKASSEKSEAEKKELTEKLDTAYREIKKLEKLSDPAVGKFKVRVDVLQESFKSCIEAAKESEDPEKLKESLKRLMDMLKSQI